MTFVCSKGRKERRANGALYGGAGMGGEASKRTKSRSSEAIVILKGGARKRADDVRLFRRKKRTSEQSGLCSDVAFGTTSAKIGVFFSGWGHHGLYYR